MTLRRWASVGAYATIGHQADKHGARILANAIRRFARDHWQRMLTGTVPVGKDWAARAVRARLGQDADPHQVERIAGTLRRHLAAAVAGRVPGRTGRPISSTHPRAAYFRTRARRLRLSPATQRTAAGEQLRSALA